MMIGAQDLLMFQNSLGGLPIIHFGKEAPPRADCGLQNHRIAEFFNSLESRFRGECQNGFWRWNSTSNQSVCCKEFVPADVCYFISVHRRNTPVVQNL